MKQIVTFTEATQIFDALKVLNTVYEAKRVLHVGIGQGSWIGHLWSSVKPIEALFVDAMPLSLKVEKEIKNNPLWQYKQVAITKDEAEIPFFETTNPNENSIIDPKELSAIWPNLKEKQSYTVEAKKVDTISDANIDWLVIECLPGLSILNGATELLKNCSVVFVRVVVDENFALKDASYESVTKFLSEQGFELSLLAHSVHPAICDALYVKAYRVSLEVLQNETKTLKEQNALEKEELAKTSAEKTATLTQEKDTLTKAKEELSKEKERLKQECQNAQKSQSDAEAKLSALESQSTQLQKELNEKIATLQREKEELAKTSDEKTAALIKEKDTLTKAKEELSKEIQTLKQECQNAKKSQSDAEAKLKEQIVKVTTLESKQQQLVVKEQQIPQLEAELVEAKHRQNLFQEELIRAEAQIELIKDLLLREPGL